MVEILQNGNQITVTPTINQVSITPGVSIGGGGGGGGAPSGPAGGFLSGSYPNPTSLGGVLTGTTGNGFIGLPNQSSNPTAPATGVNIFGSGGNLALRGADGFVRTFDFNTSTHSANRTYVLPNETGTVLLGGGAVGQVPFFSSSYSLAGESTLTYDSSANILSSSRFHSLISADPVTSVVDGQLFFNSTKLDYRARINSEWINLTRPETILIDNTDSPYSNSELERNFVIYVDTTIGDVTISLQPVSTGFVQTFINIGTGNLIFDDTFAGFSGVDYTCSTQFGAVTIIYDIDLGTYFGFGALGASGGGSGTVTSFSAGNLSPLFTTSVATATTTPALTFALNNAGANTYFGNATGSSAAPSYTSAAALTRTNDTNVTLTLGGAPTTALLTATSLTLGWTGELAVTRGGTGLSTVSQGDLIYSSASNTLTVLNKNITATRYLSNTGSSNNPAWAQVDLTNGVTGVLPVANGGTGGSTGPWSLSNGGTLTGANIITSNAANLLTWSHTYTTTASGQYAQIMSGTITPRATASDVVYGHRISLTATATANNQRISTLYIDPTLASGAFTGTVLNAAEVRGRVEIRDFTTSGSIGTLVLMQSNGSQIGAWSADGIYRIGNNGSAAQISPSSDGSTTNIGGNNLIIGVGTLGLNVVANSGTGGASGNGPIKSRGSVAQTSGALPYYAYEALQVINQTGTASGDVVMFEDNVTLTAILGQLYGVRIKQASARNVFGASTGNVTLDVNGGVAVRQTTKSQITANQNDYDIGSQTSFRMSSDASRNVTGLTGGVDGKILVIRNIGSFNIVFTNEDAASTAANRITSSTGGNLTIAPNGVLMLQYDSTSSRWFDISVR